MLGFLEFFSFQNLFFETMIDLHIIFKKNYYKYELIITNILKYKKFTKS